MDNRGAPHYHRNRIDYRIDLVFHPCRKGCTGYLGPIFNVMGTSGWRMQGSSEYLIIAGVVVIVVRDIVLYCWMRRLEDR